MGAAVSAAVQGQWASFDLVKDRCTVVIMDESMGSAALRTGAEARSGPSVRIDGLHRRSASILCIDPGRCFI